MADEKQLKAMISSTSIDLPEHRKEVLDACLRLGVMPLMMEHLPALDAEAIEASLNLVDEADIYIGIFAHRYGYIPKENNPEQMSITEMEYNRSVARAIPRFIFFIHDDHPIKKASEIEKGIGGEKLDAVKKRIGVERVANFFKSPEDLRAHVLSTLVAYQKKIAESKAEGTEAPAPAASSFHYVSDIPTPPDEYIAHPYTLLQTHNLVGRQPELNLLTAWVGKPESDVYKAHILNVVAIGGMGKSALTWKWFEDVAPVEMKELAGRMWWSFYESDATFENFIIRALAYVSKRSIEEIRDIHPQDREAQLLSILDKEPYLLVLDGLERILIAYARMDAAYLSDSDYDRQIANFVADAYGLPESAAQSFTGQHLVRKTADPRAGAFLKKLSKVRAAKILISTRLYPFDLQRMDGFPLPGCYARFLTGLSDDDALNLWRSFGVSGPHDQLLPIFNSFENHALLIQALASEIANYRPAPGSFEKWREDNPQFDPAGSDGLKEAMGHVLEYALRGLSDAERNVLQTIAGFRMPTGYDTLAAILIGENKACADARELDEALAELEDRGLVGWDKRANRYDLHPIVRGVVWGGLGDDAKKGVYTSLHAHFEAVPMIEDWLKVESLEDLTPAIELYNTLIGMDRYDDAYLVFRDRLSRATLYRLSANRQRVELLKMFFPDESDELPRLNDETAQAFTLNELALAYKISGEPGRAVPVQRRANKSALEMGNEENFGTGLENLSHTLWMTGGLRESEGAARRAWVIARVRNNSLHEAVSLYLLGLAEAARKESDGSVSALRRSLQMFIMQKRTQWEGLANVYLAQITTWFGEYAEALIFASRAQQLASVNKYEADFIRAARLQGEAKLGLDDLARAEDHLHHALSRARAVNLVEEELPALTALAELGRRQGDEKSAREFLADVWEYAERGPYPLLHADALNLLARVERDAGNIEAAKEAATKAYELAWCDGPPYAYHWGLIKAQKHLEELGAELPDMPPLDESKFEPMPEVEIDPKEEEEKGSGGEEEEM